MSKNQVEGQQDSTVEGDCYRSPNWGEEVDKILCEGQQGQVLGPALGSPQPHAAPG